VTVNLRGDTERQFLVYCRVIVEPFDGSTHLCRDFHLAILLFELVYVVHLQIRVGKETGADGLKASVGNRKEATA